MIKYLFATVSAVMFAAAGPPAGAAPPKAAAPETAASGAASLSVVAPDIPSEIIIPSSVGAIRFPHQMHIKDLSVKCVDCHHQINARPLSTPHPDYFSSTWINCRTCHEQSEKLSKKAFVCSECHTARPKNIADETLSAKVVVHKQCWKCHAVGTGKEASKACEKCHSGKKRF
ncbi:MAG: hypothetical protein A3G25_06225 [Betaproteobacteria bacterium RIFCSPLOWO2_12_FULL_63_13]|nr:MAG: hypothetical protein A3G25_06225 [Betaproteobacteria bacterium RIFCSPLOWO2_12_FULL_63_13]